MTTNTKRPSPTGFNSPPMTRRGLLQRSVALVALNLAGPLAPQVVNANVTKKKYTLSVGELNGRQVYNGKPLGPTMRVNAGDTLDVELINTLQPLHDDCANNPNQPHGLNTTNLHTHGLHVSPTKDSSGEFDADNVFVNVVPTGQFVGCESVCGVDVKSSFRYGRNDFRFEIPRDHASGTFWYHAHKHGSTAQQVGGGLAGPLIVEDESGFMPAYIEQAIEKIFFITNQGVMQVSDQGDVELNPTLNMRPGEVQRWRVINGTGNGPNFAFVRPDISNLEMHLIAYDGLTLNRRVNVDYEHLDEPWMNPSALASGNRADFIVRAPATPQATAETSFFSKIWETVVGTGIARIIDFNVVVEGEPVNALWSDDTLLPEPMLVEFDNTELPKRQIAFTRQQTIDQESFDGDVAQTMTLGTAESWTVRNNTQVVHVYHIHVNPFFVTAINGQPLAEDSPLRRWQDTIGVPLGGDVEFKTRFETYTGKFVIHCHVLPHEDNGMMQVVEVVK